MRDTPVGVAAVVVLLAGLLVASAVPAAAAPSEPEERLVVSLDPDGDATVTTVYTYDLVDGDDETLSGLSDRREAIADEYAAGLRSVADGVEPADGRTMAIENPRASVERHGDVAVVRVSVTWRNLGAVEDDAVVLGGPFDDGFELDRPLVVEAPDGHEIVASAVPALSAADDRATWAADRDLSGFETTVEPEANAAASDADLTTEPAGQSAADEDDPDDDDRPSGSESDADRSPATDGVASAQTDAGSEGGGNDSDARSGALSTSPLLGALALALVAAALAVVGSRRR